MKLCFKFKPQINSKQLEIIEEGMRLVLEREKEKN